MLRRFLVSVIVLFSAAIGARGATVNVYAFNFNFSTDPTHVQIIQPVIHVGDTIHWIVDDGFAHCTMSCAGMSESWASGSVPLGGTFDHTFTHVGTFNYFCCLHGFDNGNGTASGMSGSVIVVPGTISGTVTLGNYVGTVAGQTISIEVRSPGSITALDTYSTTLDSSGHFSVDTTRVGTFDVAIKASHWLRKVSGSVTFDATGANGIAVSLINGDIDGNNSVGLIDFSRLKMAFGSLPGDSNWNPDADLDGSGSVGLGDFGILKQHFGQVGDP